MYNLHYLYEEYLSKGQNKKNTTINLEFFFKPEVPPKDIKEVKKRLSYNEKEEYDKVNITDVTNIIEYLVSEEEFFTNMDYNTMGVQKIKNLTKKITGKNENDYFAYFAETDIKVFGNGLKLKIKINMEGKKELEDIINVDGLNNFILNGKIK